MKKFKLFFQTAFLSMILATALAAAGPALAQSSGLDLWGTNPGGNAGVNNPSAYGWNGENTVANVTGLGNRDPRAVATMVIRVVLGFLGLLAVVLIIVGGFQWMSAGGDSKKVDAARQLIVAGITGLLIILAAFGISTFVVNSLITATK